MHRSVLLPLLLVSGSAFAWGDCEFTARRDATLDLAGAKKLALMTGAGDLRIVADASATKVTATGKACASSQALLDRIQLATMTEGGVPWIDRALALQAKAASTDRFNSMEEEGWQG